MRSIDVTLALLERSGEVAIPLIACAVAIGYGLTYRLWLLRSASSSLPQMRDAVERCIQHLIASTVGRPQQQPLEVARALYQQEMIALKLRLSELKTLLHIVIAISPLLGLLGTVSGMISTFDSLGDTSALSDAGAGVASGVSEALFSTQLGLIISIPGLLISRMINRRQTLIEDRFLQLSETHLQTLMSGHNNPQSNTPHT